MVRILKRYDVGRLALKGPDYPYVALKSKVDYLARLQASFGQPPLKHGDVARCNAFVFEIEEMTGRTGRFRPSGERPLYVYRFDRAGQDQRRVAEGKAGKD